MDSLSFRQKHFWLLLLLGGIASLTLFFTLKCNDIDFPLWAITAPLWFSALSPFLVWIIKLIISDIKIKKQLRKVFKETRKIIKKTDLNNVESQIKLFYEKFIIIYEQLEEIKEIVTTKEKDKEAQNNIIIKFGPENYGKLLRYISTKIDWTDQTKKDAVRFIKGFSSVCHHPL